MCDHLAIRLTLSAAVARCNHFSGVKVSVQFLQTFFDCGFRLYDKIVIAGHSIPALIRDDLADLPVANWATLRLLMGLFSNIAANSESNRVLSWSHLRSMM